MISSSQNAHMCLSRFTLLSQTEGSEMKQAINAYICVGYPCCVLVHNILHYDITLLDTDEFFTLSQS
jgi:hypothetical protein